LQKIKFAFDNEDDGFETTPPMRNFCSRSTETSPHLLKTYPLQETWGTVKSRCDL